MPLRYTSYDASTDAGFYGRDGTMQVLGGQDGAGASLAIGPEAHTASFTKAAIVRISVDANCHVRIGADAVAAAATAEYWPAGTIEARWVRLGERISVVQA